MSAASDGDFLTMEDDGKLFFLLTFEVISNLSNIIYKGSENNESLR